MPPTGACIQRLRQSWERQSWDDLLRRDLPSNASLHSLPIMMRLLQIGILGMLLLGGWGIELLHADAGQDGQRTWLRYAPLEGAAQAKYESLPASLIVLGDS